ncbi:Arylsulfatase A family protein [Candidatus Accumulibacter aalborgensis]|uniref:Arylsulfatase A family protein n=1 Tax=Candidatus Accumulibacter aalborgensis TaxID=1860102 RepID=A0A1A8XHS2_9PROT|nr:arylsulfatase [Candidatus Accumulibacter aalborgensis]SBT03488.1 Arylsulfatase A family protein [Candidatus Accumulibacter aalborgensis]
MQGAAGTTGVAAKVAAFLIAATLAVAPVAAQQVTGVLGSPSATTTIPGNQLPPPPPKFGGVIKESYKDSKTWWPPRVVPPKGAPNVLLIMTDDQGYGVAGTFGGVIPTPALDRVAKAGLRYTEFNSTALCSPTRAALITGRNHHSVGFGVISELSTGYPGYDSIIGPENATIGTILRDNGYSTSWFGKNHNTPGFQLSASGPFDQWPSGMGFQYFYGFMGGETDQWTPYLFRDHTQIFPWLAKPGYNLTTDLADEAIDHMRQLNAAAPDQPFFVYYVPGGSHSPHQPTKEWIAKFKGKFDMGWNVMREQIFANQKRLGVIPADAKLTPWPDELKQWDALTADEKKLFARQAEVFAAYTAYTDHEIGRVIQEVEDMGKLDNTLIIYIDGDNGTSPEGTLVGTPNQFTAYNGVLDVPVEEQLKYYDDWGSATTYPHMAVGWSWAFDTPFKYTKQVASHFGGTRQGMAISWPARITDVGGVRNQFHHIIDIVPTIVEATGIKAPQEVNGIKQKPIEGVSMVYTFDKANANAPTTHKTQYFEMASNRGIYHEGWYANTHPPLPPWELAAAELPIDQYKWELYHLSEDYSQADDLAAKMPDKLKEMQAIFDQEATKYQVFPLDNQAFARAIAPRPSAVAGRTVFSYSGVTAGIPSGNAPNILNKSFTITAEVEVPAGGGDGMLVTEGGRWAGYGLYIVKGQPVFTYNLLGLLIARWAGNGPPLAAGKHSIVFDFTYHGPGIAKPGTGVLTVDGKAVRTLSIPKTIPFLIPPDETFDIGMDTRTGVNDLDYKVPFRFNGKIDKLTIILGPEQLAAADQKKAAAAVAKAKD